MKSIPKPSLKAYLFNYVDLSIDPKITGHPFEIYFWIQLKYRTALESLEKWLLFGCKIAARFTQTPLLNLEIWAVHLLRPN